MSDTPGRKGRGEKSKADWLSEIHRIMAKEGLTVKDIVAAFTGEPALVGSGDCNPCFEENAGLMYCDGSGVRVLPFGDTSVPVLLLVTGGVPQFVNHSSYLNPIPQPPPNGPLEAAPPPRESGQVEQTDM